MELQAIQNILRQFPVFSVLSESECQQLGRMAEYHEIGKYNYVYLADEPSEFVYFLIRGEIKTGIHTPDGRELVKSVQHPLSLFGELGLSGEKNRAEFACSMNAEVKFLRVKTEDFRRLIECNFQLAQKLLLEMGDRLRKAERQWESLILKDVRTRIVEFIKENATERGRRVGLETLVKHSLTQQDMASLVGASRQTVTAVLNDLRKSNLIYFNRHSFLIRDMSKLN